MTAAYFEDTDRLGLGRPDAEPLATETIEEIVALISDLIESGHAYESGGDVYFRVRSFDGYGKLSNRSPEDMDQGEEAGTESLKEEPLDFALWKAHKEGEDTSWDSPWGQGRPGWHIECSAMAEAELGPSLRDPRRRLGPRLPPSRERDRAVRGGAGVPLARIWMHNGMVETRRREDVEVRGQHLPALRGARPLRSRGRRRCIWSPATTASRLTSPSRRSSRARPRVERLRNFSARAAAERRARRGGSRLRASAFLDALADDFNTPKAIAEAFDLVAEANRGELPGAGAALVEMLELLGSKALAAPASRRRTRRHERLLAERERARAAQDFERADAIRDELAALGWDVRDTRRRCAARAARLSDGGSPAS